MGSGLDFSGILAGILSIFRDFGVLLALWGPLGEQSASRPLKNLFPSETFLPFCGHLGFILEPWRIKNRIDFFMFF